MTTLNISQVQGLLDAVDRLSRELGGRDTTIRQVQVLLRIARAGDAGIDGVTLERETDSSQAATSRTLKLFGAQLGLIEFFLDPADGRRRLARLRPKGEELVRDVCGDLASRGNPQAALAGVHRGWPRHPDPSAPGLPRTSAD